jgi:hypothetical protein
MWAILHVANVGGCERVSSDAHQVIPCAYVDRLAAAGRTKPKGVREWLAVGPIVARATARRLLSRLTGTREP